MTVVEEISSSCSSYTWQEIHSSGELMTHWGLLYACLKPKKVSLKTWSVLLDQGRKECRNVSFCYKCRDSGSLGAEWGGRRPEGRQRMHVLDEIYISGNGEHLPSITQSAAGQTTPPTALLSAAVVRPSSAVHYVHPALSLSGQAIAWKHRRPNPAELRAPYCRWPWPYLWLLASTEHKPL